MTAPKANVTAIATYQAPRQTFTFPEVKEMAGAAVRSALYPSLRTPEAALVMMMLCQAEGLHPMSALRRYDIIQGRPAKKSDAMLSDFMEAGGTVKWGRVDHECVEATFNAPGLSEPVTLKWTIDDAKRAGLAGKDNWKGYTRQMLRARVISEGMRLAMPSVVVGIYTPEEVQDFDAKPPANFVQQPPAPIATPAPTVVPPRTMSAVDEHGNVLATGEHFDAETGEVEPPAEPITPNQMKALGAALGELGVHTREGRLDWTTAIIRRKIATCKDLTKAEAGKAIEAARADIAKLDHEGGADDDMPEPGSDG